ncbi:unnamed protein product [Meganyctiphanes norvegica]|uniref:Uncharacterized protein n=1 Tax=Meganyctiphanes norvegica TaxID=48144 RepID=A0AAV2RKA8_MEGNR
MRHWWDSSEGGVLTTIDNSDEEDDDHPSQEQTLQPDLAHQAIQSLNKCEDPTENTIINDVNMNDGYSTEIMNLELQNDIKFSADTKQSKGGGFSLNSKSGTVGQDKEGFSTYPCKDPSIKHGNREYSNETYSMRNRGILIIESSVPSSFNQMKHFNMESRSRKGNRKTSLTLLSFKRWFRSTRLFSFGESIFLRKPEATHSLKQELTTIVEEIEVSGIKQCDTNTIHCSVQKYNCHLNNEMVSMDNNKKELDMKALTDPITTDGPMTYEEQVNIQKNEIIETNEIINFNEFKGLKELCDINNDLKEDILLQKIMVGNESSFDKNKIEAVPECKRYSQELNIAIAEALGLSPDNADSEICILQGNTVVGSMINTRKRLKQLSEGLESSDEHSSEEELEDPCDVIIMRKRSHRIASRASIMQSYYRYSSQQSSIRPRTVIMGLG